MLRSKRSDRREKVCSVLAHAMNCFTSCSPFSFRLVPAAAWASSNLSRALLESPAYSENKASRTPVEVPGGLDSPLLERLEIVAHSSTRLVVDVCVAEAGCRTRGLPTVRGEHLCRGTIGSSRRAPHCGVGTLPTSRCWCTCARIACARARATMLSWASLWPFLCFVRHCTLRPACRSFVDSFESSFEPFVMTAKATPAAGRIFGSDAEVLRDCFLRALPSTCLPDSGCSELCSWPRSIQRSTSSIGGRVHCDESRLPRQGCKISSGF